MPIAFNISFNLISHQLSLASISWSVFLIFCWFFFLLFFSFHKSLQPFFIFFKHLKNTNRVRLFYIFCLLCNFSFFLRSFKKMILMIFLNHWRLVRIISNFTIRKYLRFIFLLNLGMHPSTWCRFIIKFFNYFFLLKLKSRFISLNLIYIIIYFFTSWRYISYGWHYLCVKHLNFLISKVMQTWI